MANENDNHPLTLGTYDWDENLSKPEMGPALPYLTWLQHQVRNADSIWGVFRHLTEALGARAGFHLENLLFKEIGKPKG